MAASFCSRICSHPHWQMRWRTRGVNNFYAQYRTLIFILKSTLDAVLKNISGLCLGDSRCAPKLLKFQACFLGKGKAWGTALGLECRRFGGTEGRAGSWQRQAGLSFSALSTCLIWDLEGWLSRVNPGKGAEGGASRDVPAEASSQAVLLAPTGILTCPDPSSASESWAFRHVC